MKTAKIRCVLSVISLFSTLLSSNVFAANQYGIVYSGGAKLGSDNVLINSLVDELTFLAGTNSQGINKPSGARWQHGWMKSTRCMEVDYFTVWQGNTVSENDNLKYSMEYNGYIVDLQVTNVEIDGNAATSNQQALAVGLTTYGGLEGGRPVYSDAECNNRVNNIISLSTQEDRKLFIETNIKLKKKGISNFTSNNLYFGITDIDNAQSYKILNTSNLLTKNDMYASPSAVLQPTDSTLYNMFVENGNYIYATYGSGQATDLTSSNIYVKVNQDTQREGVNLVFGFANVAGSGIQFYAKQYQVKYTSDDHGTVSGIKEEDVISGNNPTGSSTTPSKDYEIDYWIADKDVTLTDGKIIKKGDKITPEQVKQVVVNSDLIFTAIHKTEPNILVPNTGSSTGEMNAAVISVSVIGVLTGAFLIGLLPKITRKKVSFKK